jgi:excisionase family DNA binding protein
MIDLDALQKLVDERVEAALKARHLDPVLLTPEQAGTALGFSKRWVYDRISEGKLQAVKAEGTLRVPYAAVVAYGASCPSGKATTKARGRQKRVTVDHKATGSEW